MGNEASLEGEGQPGQLGGAVPAAGAPASISAPAGGGQLLKPSNGVPAGGTGAGHGPAMNSIQGKPNQTDPSMGPKPGGPPGAGPGPGAPTQPQGPGQGQAARKNLQVDVGSNKGGHPVSPGSSAPTSPYSLPQIAPMPSSKLCPVCKTADLTGTTDGQPNCNTCTQCRSMVCNQCGFNPNPHLTEVQEWLCLNCQMQRALGMDMETPRSKSQQQIHSPSQPSKPPPQTVSQPTPPPQTQPQPQPQPQSQPRPEAKKLTVPQAAPQSKPPAPGAIPLPGMAKAPSQPDLSRSGPGFQSQAPRQDQTRSAGSSPSRQPPPPEQPFGKLFGFGASLLNQASSLMSVDPVQTAPPAQPPSSPKPPQKQPGLPGPGPGPAAGAKPAAQPGPPRQEVSSKPRVFCPLCKTELNIGDPAKSPNYNLCTECHTQVCNMCGFNPTPHLTVKKEWLCLTCQTQRAMSGSLEDIPPPVPSSVGSPRLPGPANQQQQRGPSQQAALRPTGPQQQKPPGAQVSGPFSPVKQGAPQSKGPSQQFPATKAETEKQDQGINKKQAMFKTEKEGDIKATSKKGTSDKKDEKKSSGKQKSKHDNDSNKSSTQSLSDTGYSSDGISSSQSEITGLIQEDSMKLSERGIFDQRSPPSPSELTKLESSMRPLLESHTATDQGQHRDGRDTAEQQRPRSLSITQDQEYESDEEASDDLSCKLRHDYVEDSSESGLSPLPPRQKKSQKNLTDEEFMRRQILEMSADEEDTADVEGHVKTKRSHKHSGDLGNERRRLTQQSSSFEEEIKSTDSYKSGEADDMMASQGGLRRFKTIELNNTNSYNRDMELSTDHDLREPELEMESLTGSPEERSRGEYSSTLPATTPSYTSGTSPTSVSSMEDDSDSSPSRRQRLEEAKQQRKARHRSHGPLLPTIEDSSEEDELREEEELLREQEKMRDLEQQRIRSTARKTKRDKEELRAQRRRERSKTPPSNLSPIEDASPTEELRQAAEMEELHRSSCSEYSPSMDSEAEGFEMGSKLYKSGSEYNLPTFMSLYSPTEKTSAVSLSAAEKSLKSAEEVYEEMMRKAEMMQKQQRAPGRQGQQNQERFLQTDKKHHLDSGTTSLSPGTSPTQISAPVSFSGNDPSGRGTQRVHATQQSQVRISNQTSKGSHVTGSPQSQVRQPAPTQPQGRPGVQGKVQGQVPDPGASSLTSKMFSYLKGSSPSTSPSTSPTQSPTRAPAPCTTSTVAPTQTSQIPHRAGAPRLSRQQSSQDSPAMVSGTSSQTKPVTVNSSTSPLSSPTKDSQQTIYQTQHATTKSPTSPQKYPAHPSPQHSLQRTQISERVSVAVSTATSAGSQSSGSLPVGNISLCRISTVPGTSRVVEQGSVGPCSNIVDLRAPMKPAPIIMTDQGMDLTSLASDTRRYSLDTETPPSRHTAVQPLIMNLNAQAQPLVSTTTPTTVSVTVAASMFISQPKQPVVYGDPLQNRVDFGQGVGSAVCLTQTRPIITDPSIPKIDACLENLGIQQQQLQKQQQKLQQQQELLEQQLQQHQQNASFARYNLANQVQPILLKKDLVVSQNTCGGTQTAVSSIPKISPLPPPPLSCSASTTPTLGHDIYGGVALELKNKPAVMNLSTGKPQVMMVQLDENSTQRGTVTQLVKREEPPPPVEVLDLTGQIKPENQLACCDVVYNLPFAGSCSGPFAQRGKTAPSDPSAEPSQAPGKDVYQTVNIQASADERKSFTLSPPGRLPPSMSDNNLAGSSLQYYQRTDPGDLAVDLSTMKQAYEAGYLGMGAQYGSYTDLRHQGGDSAPPLPLRRYGSMSNINAEYSYLSRDLGGFQESNLAQYSATTAREISRMCAALNSMEQFGSRYTSNPELLQFGAGRAGPAGRLNLQQGLESIRANLLYGPDGRPTVHGQTLTNLINARQASLRSLYPPAVRTADGMIYSTINTPIASTLPITTQPAPVPNPMLRAVYGSYPSASVTAVPLASLTRLPQVTPRMPLNAQGLYRYPPPNRFSVTAPDTSSGSVPPSSTSQEAPVYLGKPTAPGSMSTTSSPKTGQPISNLGLQGVQPAHTSTVPVQSVGNEQAPLSHISVDGTTTQLPIQPQTQPQSLVKSQEQTQTQSQPQTQPQKSTVPQKQSQAITRVFPDASASTTITTSANIEREKEEERLRLQQEQLLQLERERVELEKLRQLRLQEELERDRMELQRHREKEHLLMQREIQELQTIKQQVLQQQQAERETQLVMQREQLAHQRMQLDHIQSLQQQLQQQLEDQKRQKTAAIEAAAAAAAAEAAAASAAAAAAATTAQGAIQGVMVGATTPQTISIIYDQGGRIIPQEGQSVQILPCADGQVVQAVVSTRPLHSSSSEMSLKNSEDQGDGRIMKKQNSMPRLRNGSEDESCKRIADCSVQTDDEDTEDKLMSRRRRTRRIADCSVQTDEEDQGEWDSQPIRRRRSRYSKHSEPTAETKSDASKSSIAIQTTNDSSCQTESDQLGRISPAIHITMAETSKVELLHYISAPERTHKGESLACQTDPEAQSQGVVAPQLSVPTTVSPYSTSLQLVGATPTKFERRKPDPLDIGYQQAQQQNESPSHQPPKSPQVLYSPVSPLSPHRMLETTFTSSEKLNKAHVTPQQKAFTAESPQRHQTIPRPIKSVQRSISDPKPLSPTSEDPAKTKFSLYQSQTSPASQMSALQQQNAMMRKVKRTLPSPPPDETPVPIVTPAIPHIYTSPGASQRVLPRPVQGAMKAGLLSELKAVEQESTKLRKQQVELEEEEKEIDAKLRCLELGITQRKETRVKDRERREFAYLRCMGDARDYMSDSELNNLRLAGVAPGTYEENGMLSRPSTAPLNQFTTDLNASQYPPTSSYVPYQYPQAQPTPTQPPTAAYQQIGFQTTPYPTSSQPQPGTFQPHPPQPSSYQTPGPYQTHSYGQPTYESDLGLQQSSHQGFQPPPAPLPGQTLPYPAQSMSFQPHADMLSAYQRPRQTSLADLEQKLPTNYEVISNPSFPIATSAQETGFSGVYSSPLNNAYGQYRPSDQPLTERIPSPSSGYVTDGVYATNLEQNIPRNYVMIDDISELTKENMGSADMSRVGYGSENGPRGPTYGNGSENLYGRTSNTYQSAVDSHGHSSTTVSGGTGYYYDDYKHSSRSSGGMGSQKHSSKNLAPAVSSKRSKHRKQGMEQKISKFSPIEEARDVESDLASYTMTTSTGGSCTVVSRTGVKKSYDQQKYYGSREVLEEDDRLYGSGRSRSTGYGMDKISSRDSSGYRSKSYERDAMERSQRGTHGRSGRPSMRTQNSEEESPLSPVGKPMGIGRGSVPDPHDVRNQYGSSHSLPDVQDHHIRDMPKSHVYKPDDPYLADDMHCAVSDSEAYHLGQEETDWFEKPREPRSDRSRHHGSGSHSSSSRRSNVKHTYHDYDEPPEEDLWPQDEYGHQRHSSSTSSREHRHHGSSSGRQSSSRHSSDDPRSSRSSRSHPIDPSTRSDGRVTSSSTQKRSSDPRSASPRDSGDYSHDPSSHHHGSSGQRGQRQPGSSRRQEPSSGSRPPQGLGEQQPQSQQGQQRSTAGQQMSAKQTGPQLPETGQQGQQQLGQTTRTQQQPPQQPGQQPATTMGATQSTTTAASMGTGTTQQQSKPGQAPAQARQQPGGPPTAQPAAAMAKPDTAAPAPAPTPAVAIGSKAAPQAAKTPPIPATGIGSKAAPRPGGIGSAAQQPAEGENVLTKILQGGAAEQAGKIGDAVSALGKKFTSFW
ncbi:protein bassoon isoform X1 [Sinocyclocheilus anshuiensis]|uniref:protein bassoon isoform X1 n=1 Tax=Sinocyclocheilus anshuiensis TaxID=1608454 RepID=UPI0007B82C5F|nr:PREDICTED: protein bassoon-like isoform X1 [Sinocyclocheilus anshuiensis]XP_016350081.1 PREDICTED: protein bassoon-like isoform X1 [Sinocyclocheilus anshuiensis]